MRLVGLSVAAKWVIREEVGELEGGELPEAEHQRSRALADIAVGVAGGSSAGW